MAQVLSVKFLACGSVFHIIHYLVMSTFPRLLLFVGADVGEDDAAAGDRLL